MSYSYKEWKKHCLETKESFLVLSFPAVQKLNVNVEMAVKNAEVQSRMIETIMECCPKQAAYIGLMDLSVEAQAFGMEVQFSEREVPNAKGVIVKSLEDARALQIPDVSKNRTQVYVDTIKLVTSRKKDKPVFAGTIGPFSLAGRLIDVSEIMIQAIMQPGFVHTVLEKVSAFIEQYILAFKEAGADGVIIAEPLAGLMSKEMVQTFSSDYLKKIIDKVQDDHFSVIYHNCGPSTVSSLEEIYSIQAHGYHFGNAIDLEDVLSKTSEDILVFGNVDPVKYFCDASKEEMDVKVKELFEKLGKYPNWLISSGCDIPSHAKWENIEQYFKSIEKWR